MISHYLLTAALLFCSVSIFAQDQSAGFTDLSTTSHETTAFQINRAERGKSSVRKGHPFQFGLPIVSPDKRQIDDTVCYTMRTYVVARDSEDSDSVHPAGYSTCQRASRYRLKETRIRRLVQVDSLDTSLPDSYAP